MRHFGCRKRSGIAQREPPITAPRPHRPGGLRVSAGLRAREWRVILETAPSRAQRTVVCRGLGARLPLRGQRRHCIHPRMRTGFPFHPRDALVCVPGTPETPGTLRPCHQSRKPRGRPACCWLSAKAFPAKRVSGNSGKLRSLFVE